MHAYATDAADRKTVPVKLGAAAVGVAFLIYLGLKAAGVVVPWWLDVPGPVGIATLLLATYDRLIWRWKAGPLRLSRIPYLGGTWEGTLRSSYGGDDSEAHAGKLTITQTWSSILICYEPESDRSQSLSTMAALNMADSGLPSLEYQYMNEPRSLSQASMAMHRGSARLHLDSTGKLVGDYFTGRGRETRGELEFRRVKPTETS
jgi:hypothetical protein